MEKLYSLSVSLRKLSKHSVSIILYSIRNEFLKRNRCKMQLELLNSSASSSQGRLSSGKADMDKGQDFDDFIDDDHQQDDHQQKVGEAVSHSPKDEPSSNDKEQPDVVSVSSDDFFDDKRETDILDANQNAGLYFEIEQKTAVDAQKVVLSAATIEGKTNEVLSQAAASTSVRDDINQRILDVGSAMGQTKAAQLDMEVHPGEVIALDVLPDAQGDDFQGKIISSVNHEGRLETRNVQNVLRAGGAHPPLTTQISQALLRVTSTQDKTVTEVRLYPKELGGLRFQLQHNGGAVHVSLTVERPEAMDLIRRHSEMLLQDLKDAGFSDATLDFSSWSGGFSQDPSEEEEKVISYRTLADEPSVNNSVQSAYVAQAASGRIQLRL